MRNKIALGILIVGMTIVPAGGASAQTCPFIPRTPSAREVSIQTNLLVRSSCEVPSHITLNFVPPGMLNTARGVTVTIRGPIRAPLTQIFAGHGRISFGTVNRYATSGNSFIDRINPIWWGATSVAPGDTGTDSTAAFQAALDTDKSVFVPEGIFNINGGITLNGNGQALFGNSVLGTEIRSIAPSGSAVTLCNSNQTMRDIYLSGTGNECTTTIGVDLFTCNKGGILSNVFIDHFHRGIVAGTSGVWADTLTMELNKYANIYLDASQTARISNFYLAGSPYGIQIVNGGQQNFFDQGVIDGVMGTCTPETRCSCQSINGIAINPGYHNFVNNVLIKNFGQSSVYIDGASSNNSIQHSFIWTNGGSGVEVQDAGLTKVLNSTIMEGNYGVYMGHSSRATVVANNILFPNRLGAFVDLGTRNRIYQNLEDY
jgi:Right handed beta helix region